MSMILGFLEACVAAVLIPEDKGCVGKGAKCTERGSRLDGRDVSLR